MSSANVMALDVKCSTPFQLSPVTLKVRGADERSTCEGGAGGDSSGEESLF